jgi:hypothetical protein
MRQISSRPGILRRRQRGRVVRLDIGIVEGAFRQGDMKTRRALLAGPATKRNES